MNYAIVFRLLGYIRLCEGGLMAFPAAVSVLYGEWDILGVFLFTIGPVPGHWGAADPHQAPQQDLLHAGELCHRALTWIVISIMGAVPFVLSGAIPDPIGPCSRRCPVLPPPAHRCWPTWKACPWAFCSGAASPTGSAAWASWCSCWLCCPSPAGSHVNLMKAESPGPQVEKMVPSVQATAKILYGIYLGMTVLQIVFMLAGGCPLMDTLLITFGSAGTGGFGIKNDSMASYSTYIQVVVTVFMIPVRRQLQRLFLPDAAQVAQGRRHRGGALVSGGGLCGHRPHQLEHPRFVP